MLLAAIAVTIASAPAPISVAPRVQARATVRILSAQPIRFAEIEDRSPHALRWSSVRTADGRAEPVRLLEFE